MNFPILQPLRTLQKLNSGRYQSDPILLVEAFKVLASLDTDKVKNEDLSNISNFWCKSMMNLKFFLDIRKEKIDISFLFLIVESCEVAISLYKRLCEQKLPALEPVLTIIGASSDIFNDCESPEVFPIKVYKPTKNVLLFISYIIGIDTDFKFPSLNSAINFALIASFNAHKLANDDEIFGFVYQDSDPFKNISLEILQDKEKMIEIFRNSQNFNSLGYLIICFIYQFLFDIKIPAKLYVSDFYKTLSSSFKIDSGENELNPNSVSYLFTFTDSDPIPFEDNFHPLPFICLLLKNAIIDNENILFNISNDSNIYPIISYALFYNIKKPVLYKFLSQNFSENHANAILNIKKSLKIDTPVDELIYQVTNGDKEAAIKLFLNYENIISISQLKEENSVLQKILCILLSDNIELESLLKFDEFSHIRLLRYILLGKQITQEFIIELLEKLRNKIEEITPKEYFHIILCNCIPPNSKINSYNIPLPIKIEDFITELPFPPFIAFSELVYIATLTLENLKNEKILNLISFFSLHSYLNSCNSNILCNFLLNEMPSSFFKIQQSVKSHHILKSIENPETRSIALEYVCKILDDKDITLAVADFLLKEKDSESFTKFLNLSPQSANLITDHLPKESRIEILKNFFAQDSVDLAMKYAKLIGDIDQDSRKSVLNLLCSNAFEHPKCVIKALSAIKPTYQDAKILLMNMPQIPPEITKDFVKFLKKLLSLIPIIRVTHGLNLSDITLDSPMVQNLLATSVASQKITIEWADDKKLEEKTEKPTEKNEVNIWKLPDHPSKCLCSNNFNENKEGKENLSGNERKYPLFWCYTCGIVDDDTICEHCAEYCHFGHDIALSLFSSNPSCSCNKEKDRCKIYEEAPVNFPSPEENIDNNNGNNNDNGNNKNDNSNNKSTGENKNNEESEEDKIKFDSSLIKLFIGLSKSKIVEQEPDQDENMLNKSGNENQIDVSHYDLADIEVRHLPTSRLFKSLHNSPKLSSVPDLATIIASHNPPTHLMKRSNVSPMHIVEVVGPSKDILVACNETRLSTYKIKLNQDNDKSNNIGLTLLNTLQLNMLPFQIAVCPLDPSVIAVASIYHVKIFSIDDDGTIKQTSEIELLLEEQGSHIFVEMIKWVPLSVLNLAVICNVFVKIYDVPSDCFSPVACFVPPGDEYFTSATFAYINDIQYCIIGISNGKIVVQSIDVDAASGPVMAAGFIDSSFNIPQHPILSNEENSDVLFISGDNNDLFLCKASTLLQPNVKALTIPLNDACGQYCLSSVIYNISNDDNCHYFFDHCPSGAVLEVIFSHADNQGKLLCTSTLLCKELTRSQVPILEGCVTLLSTVEIYHKLYAVSPSNGKIMSIVDESEIGSTSDDDIYDAYSDSSDFNFNLDIDILDNEYLDELIIDDASFRNPFSSLRRGRGILYRRIDQRDRPISLQKSKSDKEETPNLKVPAHFWSVAKISLNDLILTEPTSNKDGKELLSGERFIFDHRLPRKIMCVQSTNPNQLIIGFRVFLGLNSPNHRPPWIKINGRKTDVNSNPAFMLPLSPHEVKPKFVNKIELGSNGGFDINCDRIDVFVIDSDILPEKYLNLWNYEKYYWFTDGKTVFDFDDNYTSNKRRNNQSSNQGDNKKLDPKEAKIKKNNAKISYLMNLCSLCIRNYNEESKKTDAVNQPNFEILNKDSLRYIIRMIYSNKEIADASRRILNKIVSNTDEASKIWGEEIIKCINDGMVSDDCWEILWRDVSLLIQVLSEETIENLWKAKPKIEGTYAIISAFTTE